MPANLLALPTPDSPRSRAPILLVDDVPANLTAMQAVLEPLEQEVVLANSGEEALKYLLHHDAAVIVMDVQMPGVDGLETARMIRNRERTRHIPIIFVTALSREAAYVTRGYAEGGVDYLLKPLDPEILRAKVAVFVQLFLSGERIKQQALEISAQRRTEEELRRAAELEQQLVGVVGHDLRTPLSAILMTVEQQLRDQALAPSQKAGLERIGRGANRIRRIVDVLLDFTRARLGGGIPVRRAHCELTASVRHVVEEFRTVHAERKIDCLLPETGVLGEWDGDRLSQVVANLLDNALKYSPADSKVVVELIDGAPERTLIRVQNGGDPIAPHLIPTLFEPFRRADESDDHAPGSLGLGLFIASAIVHAHDGSISVRSDARSGTVFEVCLPKKLAASSHHSPCQPAAQATA